MPINCPDKDEDSDILSGDEFPEEEELDYFPEMITRPQVWLNNSIFFCFLLTEKSLICQKGNDPLSQRKRLFSSFLPSNSYVSVSNPWRAFWADRLTLCIASGITRKEGHHQVCCLKREVPGHQQQLKQTLIVRLLRRTFLTPILDCEKETEWH